MNNYEQSFVLVGHYALLGYFEKKSGLIVLWCIFGTYLS